MNATTQTAEQPIRVRFLQSIAGEAEPRHGFRSAFSFQPDDGAELHGELARKWIAAGICEAVTPGARQGAKGRALLEAIRDLDLANEPEFRASAEILDKMTANLQAAEHKIQDLRNRLRDREAMLANLDDRARQLLAGQDQKAAAETSEWRKELQTVETDLPVLRRAVQLAESDLRQVAANLRAKLFARLRPALLEYCRLRAAAYRAAAELEDDALEIQRLLDQKQLIGLFPVELFQRRGGVAEFVLALRERGLEV